MLQVVEMGVSDLIRERRKSLNLTQQDIRDRLESYGFAFNTSSIGHWEKGRAKPPTNDPVFVRALTEILQIEERDLLVAAGFDINIDTPPDQLPAEIIELLGTLDDGQLDAILKMVRALKNK